jgi:hypothetical protein
MPVYAFSASSSATARADLADADGDGDTDDAADETGADATRSSPLQAATSDSSTVAPAAATKRVDILGT